MIIEHEQALLKAQSEFESMLAMLKEASAQGLKLHEVEGNLWERLLRIGHLSLQIYIDAQGTGDLGATVQIEGRTLKRLDGLFDRRYVSVFGEHLIQRTAYGTRPTQKLEVIPLDARLGLPDSEFSYLLQDWDQSLCVKNSYDESGSTLRRILGLDQPVASLETMSRSMAQDVEAFEAGRAPAGQAPAGSLIVVTSDGKGVPMRRDKAVDGPAPKGRLKRGEKAGKKREACVGAVYTVDRFRRTGQEVLDEVLRKGKQQDRPRPQDKRLRAELTEIVDGREIKAKERIFRWFAQELKVRRGDGSNPVVCVMDGDRSLWRMAKRVLGSVGVVFVCILDLYHVLEYLWKAAYCFHAEGSEEARLFVEDRLRRILDGQVGYVIGGLKQIATKRGLSKNKRVQLNKVLKYLSNNRAYMAYDEYLREGYPIGSGVAEGACRHLVKDRMEQTGMRWRVPGAKAILKLRGVYLNDDWESFQQLRIETNGHKLYPYMDFIQLQYRKTG